MTESTSTSAGRVVILSGSSSDSEWVAKITGALEKLGVTYVTRIGSAHRVPQHVLELLHSYDTDDTPTVFITVAGMSDALSGLTDANVVSPVIACPPKSDSFGGLDVLSSLRTPPGVAPMVALDPTNAAIGAAKILGLGDASIASQVQADQQRRAKRVLDGDNTTDR